MERSIFKYRLLFIQLALHRPTRVCAGVRTVVAFQHHVEIVSVVGYAYTGHNCNAVGVSLLPSEPHAPLVCVDARFLRQLREFDV